MTVYLPDPRQLDSLMPILREFFRTETFRQRGLLAFPAWREQTCCLRLRRSLLLAINRATGNPRLNVGTEDRGGCERSGEGQKVVATTLANLHPGEWQLRVIRYRFGMTRPFAFWSADPPIPDTTNKWPRGTKPRLRCCGPVGDKGVRARRRGPLPGDDGEWAPHVLPLLQSSELSGEMRHVHCALPHRIAAVGKHVIILIVSKYHYPNPCAILWKRTHPPFLNEINASVPSLVRGAKLVAVSARRGRAIARRRRA